jgi:hypothetical protein
VPAHLKRSIGAVLDDPEQRPLAWAKHRAIRARHRCLTTLPTG